MRFFRKESIILSEKRKDNKGRILKAGESQRKDGIYMYRYADIRGKRRYIYASLLEELRINEQTIQRDLGAGIDYAAGEMSVSELVARYIKSKRGLKRSSQRAYDIAVKRIDNSEMGQQKVNSVKLSDAKMWLISLHDDGAKKNTIMIIQNVIRPAFEMAVDDDIVRKNPFKFRLSDIISSDITKKDALTKVQQEQYLQIAYSSKSQYYNDIVILLGTGMRVSELYGLTDSDIDFNARCVKVRRQLCRDLGTPYYVTSPKSESGIRDIPMSQSVYEAFRRVVQSRGKPKVEMLIDGCCNFLFLNRAGLPRVAKHLQDHMKVLQGRYIKQYGESIPTITPHVLRHTFCTNAQQAGIDIKSLQYLMGHANASMSLDVYSHADYYSVENAFFKVTDNL